MRGVELLRLDGGHEMRAYLIVIPILPQKERNLGASSLPIAGLQNSNAVPVGQWDSSSAPASSE